MSWPCARGLRDEARSAVCVVWTEGWVRVTAERGDRKGIIEWGLSFQIWVF